jgi:hypothetical protein
MARTGKRRNRAAVRTSDISDQPRMKELYGAALTARGSIDEMLEQLGVPFRVLAQRLSMLRALGVAKLVTLHDPVAHGAGQQMTVWVRVACDTPAALARFERDLIEDPSVSGAQSLLGDFDYRLSTFHTCWREAAAWTRDLRNRPEVLAVRDVTVRPLFGDDLPGLVLRGAPPRGQRSA